MTFGKRLKEVLKNKGITQKELARALGIPYTTLNNWIRGAADPNLSSLIILANYLDVDLHWLITGKYQNNGKAPKVQIKTGANSQVSSTEVNHVKGKNIIVSGIVELGEGRKPVKLNKSTQELLELINKLNPKQQKALKQFILTLLNSNMEE